MVRRSAPMVALVLALVPASASATWSIVAVDPQTQEVGVAVATCVEAPFGTQVLPTVPGLAPGIGALAAQAQLDPDTRDYALMLLESGVDAQGVLDMTNAMDFGAETRQYGVVRLAGDTATFTGTAALDWAGDLQSTNVTAQGNILYGPEVVADALAAFEAEPTVCPWTLADRLMVALEAGSAQGGDSRCSMAQSALVAVLQVARPTDTKGAFTIDLLIPSEPQGGDNPVTLLRAAYDEWRAMNPPDDSECTPGSESSSSGDGGESSGSTTASADDTTATPDTSSGSANDSSSTGLGTTAPSDSSGGSTGGAAQGDEGGCACDTTRGGALGWLALAPLLLLVRVGSPPGAAVGRARGGRARRRARARR